MRSKPASVAREISFSQVARVMLILHSEVAGDLTMCWLLYSENYVHIMRRKERDVDTTNIVTICAVCEWHFDFKLSPIFFKL